MTRSLIQENFSLNLYIFCGYIYGLLRSNVYTLNNLYLKRKWYVIFDEYGNRENPTILLLHGAGALDTFCNQYCFSENYHLIVPHLHGAGKLADKVYNPDVMERDLGTDQ